MLMFVTVLGQVGVALQNSICCLACVVCVHHGIVDAVLWKHSFKLALGMCCGMQRVMYNGFKY